jgi:hypothetical protein
MLSKTFYLISEPDKSTLKVGQHAVQTQSPDFFSEVITTHLTNPACKQMGLMKFTDGEIKLM